MKIKLIVFYFFIVGFINNVKCQTIPDTELWTGGALKFKLNKQFRLDVEQQLRLDNNVSSIKKTFTEVGLKYKFSKEVSVKTNLRYTARPNKVNEFRYSLDGYYSLKKKKNPLSFDYRLRYQKSKRNMAVNATTYLRNKFSLGYNLTKLVDPEISFEKFYRFNLKNEFRLNRFTFGLNWKLNKKFRITSYYRVENEINVKNPQKAHIVGLFMSYSFKKKKK